MLKTHPLITHKINRRGHMVKTCTEHYLRNDIPCCIENCETCANDTPFRLAAHPHPIVILSDPEILQNYSEILALLKSVNFVIPTSVLNKFRENVSFWKMKTFIKVLREPNRRIAIFDDIFSSEVHSAAENKMETDDQTVSNYVRATAEWYSSHSPSTEIVIIKKGVEKKFQKLQKNIFELTMEQFCKNDLGILKKCASFEEILNNSREKEEVILIDITTEENGEEKENFENLLPQVSSAFDSITNSLPSVPTGKEFCGTYEPFLSRENLDRGISQGKIFRGIIHFDENNWQEAFVKCYKGAEHGSDCVKILVFGRANLNRVINGDEVAVTILPEDQWRVPTSEITVHEDGEEENTNEIKESTKNTNNNEINVDFSIKEKASSQPNGKVVGVFKRNWRPYAATLQFEENEQNSSKNWENVLCVPFDSRVQKILLRTRQTAQYSGRRLKLIIDRWEEDSIYPRGHLAADLGPIGDLEAETKVIMIENGLEVSEFGKSLEECLEKDWVIPKKEIDKRKDLRGKRLLFSIDPIGCEDIDDVISVHRYEENIFEIGVHIADVTYFVSEKSPVDNEAKFRGTSVYLKDRRVDMIPKRLSAQECSMHEGKDRLAVSVFWKVSLEQETPAVLDAWFERTVVRSSYSLNYTEANLILENKTYGHFTEVVEKMNTNSKKILEKAIVMDKNAYKEVRNSLLVLSRFASYRRTLRDSRGAVSFGPDWRLSSKNENSSPGIKEMVEKMSLDDFPLMNTHNIIEEMMIFTNSAVAGWILEKLPLGSLLRCHPPPSISSSREANDKLEAVGLGRVDFSSNAALAKYLKSLDKKSLKEIAILILRMSFSEAEYFVSGDDAHRDYSHFGLAIEHYTHFTSPIRRYADIIVHRTLLSQLPQEQKIGSTKMEIESELKTESECKLYDQTSLREATELSNHLNLRNRSSRNVQRLSREFSRVNELTKCFYYTRAVVTGIRENGLIVLVPFFAVDFDEDILGEEKDESSYRGAVMLKNKNGKFNEPFQLDCNDDLIGKNECKLTRQSKTEVLMEVRELAIKKVFKLREKIPVQIGINHNSKNIYRFPKIRIRYAHECEKTELPHRGLKIPIIKKRELNESSKNSPKRAR